MSTIFHRPATMVVELIHPIVDRYGETKDRIAIPEVTVGKLKAASEFAGLAITDFTHGGDADLSKTILWLGEILEIPAKSMEGMAVRDIARITRAIYEQAAGR